MSNIRHGALIKNPPPLLLKRSAAHFDIVTDFTADGSQEKEAFGAMATRMTIQAGARKRFVAKAGLEMKTNMTGKTQKNYAVSPGPTIDEYGQTNNPFPGEHQFGPNGEALTERLYECAYFFPFNRWNLLGHGTLTASTQVATYPATNTYLQQPSKVWRSTSTTASLTRDLANPYRISAVCITGYNLTKDGTFRVRVGNDSTFATTKYDSGTIRMWEPSFATTGLYAEEADSEGYPTSELIELLRYCGENPRTVRWVTFTEVNAQYVRIDFSDPTNTRGLVEIAYVYVGIHKKVKPDQIYNWQLTPVGNSRIKKSASGSMWIDSMFRAVSVTANFASQPEANTIAFFNFLAGYLGKRTEFFVAFQPDNLPRKQLFTLYGKFAQPPQLENIALKNYNVVLEVEELVG